MPKYDILNANRGLNLRAAESALAQNEFLELQNAVLDERGALVRRNGKAKLHTSEYANGITSFFTTTEPLQRGSLAATFLVFDGGGNVYALTP